jgi:hypothetical protein
MRNGLHHRTWEFGLNMPKRIVYPERRFSATESAAGRFEPEGLLMYDVVRMLQV